MRRKPSIGSVQRASAHFVRAALPLCTDGLGVDDVVARILELWYARAKHAG